MSPQSLSRLLFNSPRKIIFDAGYIEIISQLLVLLHTAQGCYAQFLESVSGTVSSGNYSYFKLIHPGHIGLELISDKGDCDMYLSQYESKPTYDPYTYSLQSATIGIDKLIVPDSFQRPVTIGIYGHPSHEREIIDWISKC